MSYVSWPANPRVAVARKLAGICWVRLKRWHAEHAAV